MLTSQREDNNEVDYDREDYSDDTNPANGRDIVAGHVRELKGAEKEDDHEEKDLVH